MIEVDSSEEDIDLDSIENDTDSAGSESKEFLSNFRKYFLRKSTGKDSRKKMREETSLDSSAKIANH